METSFKAEVRLWLIRHGEPEASARGRCYGSLDVGLSPQGHRQAQTVASQLKKEPLAAIYSSPRLRCRQGAAILANGRNCEVEVINDLTEIDFGQFEGRTYDEIAVSHPEFYQRWMKHPTEIEFPGGESFAAMRARVIRAADRLRARHRGESVAIVTHGGVIRILLAESLAIASPNIFQIGQRYAALNLISYVEGCPIVEMVNGSAV